MGREVRTQLVYKLPDYTTFNYARLGSFSLSTYNTRYIAFEDVIHYDGKDDTAGVHYRNYIADRAIKFPRKNAPDLSFSYPYFAHPARLPMAFYVDLRRAYQQIAYAYGFELWFKEGKSIGIGDVAPSGELFDISKVARGLLITGHAERARFTEWKDSDLKEVSFPNSNYAPYLRYAIYRTLHAIMSKLKPYIYYAHTDGVIINHRMISRVDKILARYGFDYAIKMEGEAIIKTTGCYQVGEHQTGTFKLGRFHASDYILSDDNDDWWLKVFTRSKALRASVLLPPD